MPKRKPSLDEALETILGTTTNIDVHLTSKESSFYNSHTFRDLNRKIEQLNRDIEKLNQHNKEEAEWKSQNYLTWYNNMRLKYHPELEEYEKNPDAILDPDDLTCNITLGDQPKVFRPKTNLDRFREITNRWSHEEWEKTSECKRYNRYNDKLYKIQASIKTANENIKKLTRIQQIIDIETIGLGTRIVTVVHTMLKPSNDNSGSKKAKKDGKVKGIMIPFQHEKEWLKSSLSIDGDEFNEEVIVLRQGLARKSDIWATIDQQGNFKCRVTEYTEAMVKSLKQFSKDPKEFLSTTGKELGICLICSAVLSDKISLENGYGPICAKAFRHV